MDVNVVVLIEIHRNAEQVGAAAHHRHRRADGLLHHLTELTGVLRFAFPGRDRGLDGQKIAAHLRPRKAGHLADAIFLIDATEAVALYAQVLLQLARRDARVAL